jgi:hypothetical protein
VDLVLKEKLSMCKAADLFDIPFSTLQKKIKTKNFGPPSLGCTPIFTQEQEYYMAEHIKSLAKLFYGLSDCYKVIPGLQSYVTYPLFKSKN